MPILLMLLQLLITFLTSVLKLDPETTSIAEAMRQAKTKRFREWFAKRR